jgi:hypothetical protein
MSPYLASTEIIDHRIPTVRRLAFDLVCGERNPLVVARRCFEWVRDSCQAQRRLPVEPGHLQRVGSARRGHRLLLRQEPIIGRPAAGQRVVERPRFRSNPPGCLICEKNLQSYYMLWYTLVIPQYIVCRAGQTPR